MITMHARPRQTDRLTNIMAMAYSQLVTRSIRPMVNMSQSQLITRSTHHKVDSSHHIFNSSQSREQSNEDRIGRFA